MSIKTFPTVLTIAGSDSGGGAGIQADLKTFQALGCYGLSVITALTAQNTQTVKSIYKISANFVEDQLSSVFEDITIDAVKIGMLFSVEIIEVVEKVLKTYSPKNVVLDTVMISKSGKSLLQENAVEALKEVLFPITTIITPNIPEAEKLSGMRIFTHKDRETIAHKLAQYSCHVLIKGGHENNTNDMFDLFVSQDRQTKWLSKPRIHTQNTHGTGCTYSAAIAAFLSKGFSALEAVLNAREYLQGAIQSGATLKIGHGYGPVNHSWNIRET